MKSLKQITANGKPIEASLPCTLEQFLVAQKLLPRSVCPLLPQLPQRLIVQV